MPPPASGPQVCIGHITSSVFQSSVLPVGWMRKPSVLQQPAWDSLSLSRGSQPGLLGHHGKHTKGWTPNPGVQPQLCGRLGCGPGITLPSLSQIRTLREAPLLFTSSRHFLQEGPFDDPHGPFVPGAPHASQAAQQRLPGLRTGPHWPEAPGAVSELALLTLGHQRQHPLLQEY